MDIMQNKSYLSWLREKAGPGLILSPSVAAVIRDAQGRLLLQEKSSGEAWSLPAGGIELGESPQEAIIREVMEETGFEVQVERILAVYGGSAFRYTYPNGDEVEYVVTLFECRIVGGAGIPTDNETRSTHFFHQEEMPPLALPYPTEVLFGRSSDK
jgi:8-oxo-dGTP pyrophosphatase MutT (NUDIX family)